MYYPWGGAYGYVNGGCVKNKDHITLIINHNTKEKAIKYILANNYATTEKRALEIYNEINHGIKPKSSRMW